MRVLYQFPISHFCEKTRWHLDHKRLEYRVQNVVPGFHALQVPRAARRLRRRPTVPILADGERVVCDSTDIAMYLEETYPERPLVPADPRARAKVLEIEQFFDEEVGPHVRRFVYGTLLRERRGAAAEALFAAYSTPLRWLGKAVAPVIERAMVNGYRIDDTTIARSRAKIIEGFDRIERETGGDPAKHLAGGDLSIADVAAASFLSALVATKGSPYQDNRAAIFAHDELRALHEDVATRPGAAWVEARYRDERRST